MSAEVIFDRMASREYLKARRWYAAQADERIAWMDSWKWLATTRTTSSTFRIAT